MATKRLKTRLAMLTMAFVALLATANASAQSLQNGSHSTVGYISSDGTVQNSSHSTIGYFSGIKPSYAALFFFFFF